MYVFPSILPTPTNRVTRGRYTVSLLNDAVKAVMKDNMSCYQAAQIYKIPRSTIQRRVANIKDEHRRASRMQFDPKRLGGYTCQKPYRYKNTEYDLKDMTPSGLVRDIRRAGMLQPLQEPERYRQHSFNILAHDQSIEESEEYQTQEDQEHDYYVEERMEDGQNLIYINDEAGTVQKIVGLGRPDHTQPIYVDEEIIEYVDNSEDQQLFLDADEIVVVVDDGMDVAQECEVATEEQEFPSTSYILDDGVGDQEEELEQKPCISTSYVQPTLPVISTSHSRTFSMSNRMSTAPSRQVRNVHRDFHEKSSYNSREEEEVRNEPPPKKMYSVIRVIGPPPAGSQAYISPPSLECERNLTPTSDRQKIDVD